VLESIKRAMDLAEAPNHLRGERELLLKLNLSWTKYFPHARANRGSSRGSCNISAKGYRREQILPVENKTVVTNPRKGAANNLWFPVLEKYGLELIPLPRLHGRCIRFENPSYGFTRSSRRDRDSRPVRGKDILHLPTVKTHGHSVTTVP